MKRIVIFGNSGSGKSTLAQESSGDGEVGHLDLVDFPGFARHQIALICNSMRCDNERQTVYRRI